MASYLQHDSFNYSQTHRDNFIVNWAGGKVNRIRMAEVDLVVSSTQSDTLACQVINYVCMYV